MPATAHSEPLASNAPSSAPTAAQPASLRPRQGRAPTWTRRGGLALAAGLPLASAGGAATAASPPPTAQQTALLVSAIGVSRPLPGSDGMMHVEYDLLLANAFSAPVTLTAIAVLDPDGHPLLQLEGAALTALTQPVFGGPPTGEIPTSGVVATVIDLVVPPDAVPARVTHRVTYALPPAAPALALISTRRVDGPELAVDPGEAEVVAPPLRGAGWFHASGCCVAHGYVSPHRASRGAVAGARYVKNEAFAIDWVRLRGGRFADGDGGRNEQHFAFGAQVVAAAAGTVVVVRDGMPEGTPFRLPATLQGPSDYAGNRVVVRQGPDVWAPYAHLRPGSILVREGEQVAPGQPVGQVGNTGNSFAPHLHFQLSDGPDLGTSNSLPFVLDRYDLAGTVAPDALSAALTDPGAASELAAVGPGRPEAGTHPLLLAVTDFR